MQRIEFFVPGIPQPAGSKRGFVNKKTGGVIITDACRKSKPWQADVKHFAFRAYQGPPLLGAIRLEVEFRMVRPKGHYGTGRNAASLRASAPMYHTTRPDRTKLLRGLEDALSGLLWKDDAQVVQGEVEKCYADGQQPGAYVIVESLAEGAGNGQTSD